LSSNASRTRNKSKAWFNTTHHPAKKVIGFCPSIGGARPATAYTLCTVGFHNYKTNRDAQQQPQHSHSRTPDWWPHQTFDDRMAFGIGIHFA
jgi:hypothetical protein